MQHYIHYACGHTIKSDMIPLQNRLNPPKQSMNVYLMQWVCQDCKALGIEPTQAQGQRLRDIANAAIEEDNRIRTIDPKNLADNPLTKPFRTPK